MCKYICNGDFIKKIESKCKNVVKNSEQYKESNKKFLLLLAVSIIILILGLIIGAISDLILQEIYKSLGKSFNTLFMFMAGITAGFTIEEYKNNNNILKNACTLRPEILFDILNDCEKKGEISPPQKDRCIVHVKNGFAQMQIQGSGDSALRDVVENIQKEVCNANSD